MKCLSLFFLVYNSLLCMDPQYIESTVRTLSLQIQQHREAPVDQTFELLRTFVIPPYLLGGNQGLLNLKDRDGNLLIHHAAMRAHAKALVKFVECHPEPYDASPLNKRKETPGQILQRNFFHFVQKDCLTTEEKEYLEQTGTALRAYTKARLQTVLKMKNTEKTTN